MKISLNWLQDFVTLKTQDLALIQEKITNCSAEVEAVIEEGKAFENVVVGQILQIEKHPDAEKLQVTQTTIGAQTLQIVCGAKNIQVGQKVPVALPGAHLPNGAKIEKTKIRGTASFGMLCSEMELGIAEESAGIWILPETLNVGIPLKEYLGLDDVTLEIANLAITNRPDLFSHLGFAYEFVANGLGELKQRTEPQLPVAQKPFPLKITVESPDLCPAYSAVVVEKIKIEPSPEWMQKRLRAVGIRPLNNIVDITNYVMMELGVPLHAFDLQKIDGKEIKMRRSKAGEKMVTLDSIERTLPAEVIILEDQTKIFDLCGIMGGENSEISAGTQTILLHAPIYHPILIRKGMLALNHRTEAATMYEKGVPEIRSREGLNRALALILELLPEAQIMSEIYAYPQNPPADRFIDLPKSEIERVFALKIADKKIEKILTNLGFTVQVKPEKFEVKVPPYRFGDVTGSHDLIEELMRIYDLNLLPEILPTAPLKPAALNQSRLLEKKIKYLFCAFGLNEVLTYAFIGQDLIQKSGLAPQNYCELQNPLSQEISIMRPSLLPGLLETAERNLRQESRFGIFEFGKTYLPQAQESFPREEEFFTGVLLGADFFEVKGQIETIFKQLNFPINFQTPDSLEKFMHPGKTAEIVINKKPVGVIAELHPQIGVNFDFKPPVAIFEINFSLLAQLSAPKLEYISLPKFPSIKMDLSVIADLKTPAEKLSKLIQKTDPLISSVEIMDEYTGAQIPAHKKSLTFALTYQSLERTLTDAETIAIHQQVLLQLEKHGAAIRQ